VEKRVWILVVCQESSFTLYPRKCSTPSIGKHYISFGINTIQVNLFACCPIL
jgi:hypothetical protein